jgi:hypothetical protein
MMTLMMMNKNSLMMMTKRIQKKHRLQGIPNRQQRKVMKRQGQRLI